MKRRLIKRAAISFCVAAVLVANSFEVLAANAQLLAAPEVNFGSDNQIGIQAVQDRDLFDNMKDLVPGDIVTNTIDVANTSSQAVTIYLKAYPQYEAIDAEGLTAKRTDLEDGKLVSEEGKSFRNDLLEVIGMNIKLDGQDIYGDETFSLSAAGEGDLVDGTYGISLGSFPANTVKKLSVTIHLPGEKMGNEFMDTFDAVDWVFYVEGEDHKPDPDPGPDPAPDPDPDPNPDPSPDPGPDPNPGGGDDDDDDDDTPPGPITIVDPPVPLGNITGGDGDLSIVIADEGVPLASLPKMGDSGIENYVFGILLVLLAASGAVYLKKRLNRS